MSQFTFPSRRHSDFCVAERTSLYQQKATASHLTPWSLPQVKRTFFAASGSQMLLLQTLRSECSSCKPYGLKCSTCNPYGLRSSPSEMITQFHITAFKTLYNSMRRTPLGGNDETKEQQMRELKRKKETKQNQSNEKERWKEWKEKA